MQFRFLQTSFRYLVTALTDSAHEYFMTTINIKMSVFIVFVIVSVMGHLFFWLPFMTKLNRDVRSTSLFTFFLQIQRTRQMLTIVPIEVVLRRPKILEYLNEEARSTKE